MTIILAIIGYALAAWAAFAVWNNTQTLKAMIDILDEHEKTIKHLRNELKNQQLYAPRDGQRRKV